LIRFINQHYGENIADSSYDDIRRKNLDFLVEAGLVVRSANRPGAPTNDGTRGYAVAKDAVELFTKYGKPGWRRTLEKWKKEKGCLATKLARPRKQHLVPVRLPDGSKVDLSKGKHNELQKRIIEDFLPRFLLDPELLYLGDTANKILIHEKERLIEIGLAEFNHDTLPDIVVLDKKQNWVYFIEAVHSSNPISRIRHLKLEKLSSGCSLGKVFVSAFLDRNSFRKWISEISWETEVWLASEPSHMIHFNGDRFMGPHDTVDN
jgi:type II restriction enzyme